jgi:NADH-quinone oxidoreductase subunit A
VEYFPVLVLFLFGLSIALGIIVLDLLLGPKNPNRIKCSMYECGVPEEEISGGGRMPFSVKYYLVALLFILFDIEALFLYPLVVNYRNNMMVSFVEIQVFMAILVIVYLFVWRKGGFKWD